MKIGDQFGVRRIGLGAMRIMRAGPEGATALLKRARELGVNFIDTADVYGHDGASERMIAQALRPYASDLVIATKGGQILTDGRPGANGTPEHLRSACEASLQRLGLEQIPLYQLHNVDPNVPLEESLGALAELQAEGRIRHIGVCNLFGARLERALELVAVASVQNRYSLWDRQTEGDLKLCERRGIAFIPYLPLAGGVTSPASELVEIADAHGATPAQVALAWLLRRSPVTLPIPGTSSVEHLEENTAAAELQLGDEEMAQLEASC